MKNKPLVLVILSTLAVMGCISFASTALANPPSSMTLAYDLPATSLNVTISHSVTNPSSHYIQSVEIEVNGTNVKTETYSSQPTDNSFMYQYNITATNGVSIEVTAKCNLSGQITESIIVGEGPSNKIPGYYLIGLFSILSIGLLLIIIRKKIARSS